MQNVRKNSGITRIEFVLWMIVVALVIGLVLVISAAAHHKTDSVKKIGTKQVKTDAELCANMPRLMVVPGPGVAIATVPYDGDYSSCFENLQVGSLELRITATI